MDILLARKQVVEIGKRLVEYGLIARTWGNVSCRVDEKTFVITPSGRPYDSLKPEEIVKVDIGTLEHEGNIKPSSEKGVHAEVYKHYKKANFVIHTHQSNASVVSALGKGIDSVSEEYKNKVGSKIPLANYGLPGTKKLRQGVAEALSLSDAKAIVMAHHGAVCYGADSEEAFSNALMLENECGKFISEIVCEDETHETFFSSERKGDEVVFTPADGAESLCVKMKDTQTSEEMKTHIAIYNAREDINFIVHSVDKFTLKVSRMGRDMKPYLDDFAQIVGTTARCAEGKDCVNALKGRNAVLVKNEGALCCGVDEGDAHAVKMIVDKNSKTVLGVLTFRSGSPIKVFEAKLMRVIYLKKYSKQAEKNK